MSKRRDFIKASAAAGASFAASSAQSAPKKEKRKLRVGALQVGDFSMWPYTWGNLLSPYGKFGANKTLGTDLLNMEITHVWDVDPTKAREFADQVGAEVVKKYDDMVGKVDGVAFGGYYEVPWQNKFARPYIAAGIPTYLSRPFAYSLRDIDEMLDLAAEHNTPLIATDLYEHIYGASTLKGKLKNAGEILCVHGTCLTQEYGGRFHVQFMILKILGFDVKSVGVITDDANNCKYLGGSYIYKGWEGQPPFLCELSGTTKGDLYSITVTGTEGIESVRLAQFSSWQDDLLTHHLPLIIAMQKTFEGHNYEPFDLIRKKTEIFLTGFYSAEERGGAPVDVGTVPINWRARVPKEGWIDEGMFR